MLRFQGVFAVLCTPFTASGELDEASLRREVRFCRACRVDGLVAPVNAGEFFTLTDAERMRVVEVVAEENAGAVPFVAGCSALSTQHAVALGRQARRAGADAVMAMPPVIRKADEGEIASYYRALAEAAGLPVVVQDYVLPIGTPMSVDLLVRLIRDLPGVDYLKEETLLGPQVLSAVRKRCGDALRGVMGGQGGRFLFTEHARGACGTMPACHVAEAHVAVWSALAAGDEEGARSRFALLLPLLNLEHMYGVAVYKHVLHRRGVFATPVCRGAPATLDEFDRRELDRLLRDAAPLLTAGV